VVQNSVGYTKNIKIYKFGLVVNTNSSTRSGTS